MRAICTVGEGPDVIVNLNGKQLFLLEKVNMEHSVNGTVCQGSIDLIKKKQKCWLKIY